MNEHPSRRRLPRREPPKRRRDDYTLPQIGLGGIAPFFLFVMALFPFVGLIMGAYYSDQPHYAARSFGRMMLAFAMLLHFLYFCVICPLLTLNIIK
jgi:hypothetical protein